MVGVAQRKPELKCLCAMDVTQIVGQEYDLRERRGTLDVILDHRYASSLDSSSLYVIVATFYSIRHLTCSQWSVFSVLGVIMRPHWRVTTQASVFWYASEVSNYFCWHSPESHWHSQVGILSEQAILLAQSMVSAEQMCRRARMWKKHDRNRADMQVPKHSLLSELHGGAWPDWK